MRRRREEEGGRRRRRGKESGEKDEDNEGVKRTEQKGTQEEKERAIRVWNS